MIDVVAMFAVVYHINSSRWLLGLVSHRNAAMLIFWSGKGWVVPAATFGASLLAEILSENITGDDQYYQTHGFAFSLALWASAAINLTIFWPLYKERFVNTNERRPKRRPAHLPGWIDHSFMLINQGAWIIALLFGGFAILFSRGI